MQIFVIGGMEMTTFIPGPDTDPLQAHLAGHPTNYIDKGLGLK